MRANGILVALLLCLLLAACAPIEDAKAAFASLLEPSDTSMESASSSVSSVVGASDAERALALAFEAETPGCPGLRALAFCTQVLPGGDWSSTATTAEYLAEKQLEGEEWEIRLQFTVDLEAGTAALTRCEADDALYTGEQLRAFLQGLAE